MRKVTRTVPRPERKRINQPMGYAGKKAVHKYKCKTHDYVYYGEDWYDHSKGMSYRKGFYDELGNRYDSLIIHNTDGTLESLFECEYCGTQTKAKWVEGAIPQCQNCGANFTEIMTNAIHDTVDTSTITEERMVETVGSKISRVIEKIILFFFTLPFIIGIGFVGFAALHEVKEKAVRKDSNIDLFGKEVYVESIDRTLEWNDKYESYYDPVSDCYIWYNTDVEPAVWQYWYEDISSDFGDYGWMEYELQEDQWYIEKSKGNWIELPERYDASKLWHITGELAGTSYSQDLNLERFGDYVYVDGEPDKCKWDEDFVSYKVRNHDCYIRINFDVNDPTIQYWYEDISSSFSKDGYGGWMEYDYKDGNWYVVDSNDEWAKIDGDMSDVWHVERSVVGKKEYSFMVKNGEQGSFVDMDEVDNSSVYLNYSFYAYEEGDEYFDLSYPIFYFGSKHTGGVDENFNTVDDDSLNAFTEEFLSAHKDEMQAFFEEHKNDVCVDSSEDLERSHYTLGETMDVTDWFDGSMTITINNGNKSNEYKFYKVELAIERQFFFGDLMEIYEIIADAQPLESGYVYVRGIEFEFFLESEDAA